MTMSNMQLHDVRLLDSTYTLLGNKGGHVCSSYWILSNNDAFSFLFFIVLSLRYVCIFKKEKWENEDIPPKIYKKVETAWT